MGSFHYVENDLNKSFSSFLHKRLLNYDLKMESEGLGKWGKK